MSALPTTSVSITTASRSDKVAVLTAEYAGACVRRFMTGQGEFPPTS